MEITARLIERFDVTTHGESFRKQEFVIETEGEYPQTIKMQAVQDKIEKIEKLTMGGIYNFHFNLRGRKWISPEGKTVYFNTIDVWRVETAEEVQDTDITPEQAVGTPPQTSQLTDDLPF